LKLLTECAAKPKRTFGFLLSYSSRDGISAPPPFHWRDNVVISKIRVGISAGDKSDTSDNPLRVRA